MAELLSLLKRTAAGDYIPRTSLALCASALGVKAPFIHKLLRDGIIERPAGEKWVPADVYEAIANADKRSITHGTITSRVKKQVSADDIGGSAEENEAIAAISEERKDVTYHEARTANEILRARQVWLKTEKMRNSLVDRKKVIELVTALAQAERESILSFATRFGALIASELGSDPVLTGTVLEKFLREHMSNMAEFTINV